jgi:hypothetical protein
MTHKRLPWGRKWARMQCAKAKGQGAIGGARAVCVFFAGVYVYKLACLIYFCLSCPVVGPGCVLLLRMAAVVLGSYAQ